MLYTISYYSYYTGCNKGKCTKHRTNRATSDWKLKIKASPHHHISHTEREDAPLQLCCQSCLACIKLHGQDLTWAPVFVLWCKQEVEPSNA